MRIRLTGMGAVAVAFLAGVAVPPAAALSAAGPWESIFGSSNSCAWGRASVNDVSEKAGSIVKNVKGCTSASASAVSVPAGYLGATVYLNRWITGSTYYQCQTIGPVYNGSSTTSLTVTTNPRQNTSGCPSVSTYNGQADNYRFRQNYGTYAYNYVVSRKIPFG